MALSLAADKDTGPVKKTKWYRQLYFWVIVAIVLGALVGWLWPRLRHRDGTRRHDLRVGGDLVLHLHRLDDAEELALLDGRRPARRAPSTCCPAAARRASSAPPPPLAACALARWAPSRARRRRGAVAAAPPPPANGGADDLARRSACRRPRPCRSARPSRASSSSSAGVAGASGTASVFSHALSSIRSRQVSPSRPLLGRQQRLVERDQRLQALDLVLAQRAQHALRGLLAVGVPDDQLGDHRVVHRRDLAARARRPSRRARPGPPARGRRRSCPARGRSSSRRPRR